MGQALVRRLSGWPGVHLLATAPRDQARFSAFDGGFAPLDVTNRRALERTLLDVSPTHVIHLAAMSQVEACETDKEACWNLNVDATAYLAALCHRHGARLVFLSTDFVFDGTAGPYDESSRPAPINTYGRSKLAAENEIRRAGRNWTIVRTTLVLGHPVGDARLNLATWLLRELQAGRPVRVADDQIRTPTYAPDLADGVMRTIRFGTRGLFHIAGRDALTPYAFAVRLAERLRLDASLISPASTAEIHPGAPRPLKAGLVTTRAEAELRYRPRPIDAMIDAVGAAQNLLPPRGI